MPTPDTPTIRIPPDFADSYGYLTEYKSAHLALLRSWKDSFWTLTGFTQPSSDLDSRAENVGLFQCFLFATRDTIVLREEDGPKLLDHLSHLGVPELLARIDAGYSIHGDPHEMYAEFTDDAGRASCELASKLEEFHIYEILGFDTWAPGVYFESCTEEILDMSPADIVAEMEGAGVRVWGGIDAVANELDSYHASFLPDDNA